MSEMKFGRFLLLAGVALHACANPPPAPDSTRLRFWDRGVAVDPGLSSAPAMYLWFYEWNMFDAVLPGQHTLGRRDSAKAIDPGAVEARLDLREAGLILHSRARSDGAELVLDVTNRSGHDWPELAAIVPCFSPGMAPGGGPATPAFATERTWFVGPNGLEPLRRREIHFNAEFRKAVGERSRDGRFEWSDKWPEADPDAGAGLLLRESDDGAWVAGIAWEDFLSVQGHNPWRCMHLSVRVGPLARGQSRTIRGRIYLFRGTKEAVLDRFKAEFGR
jgi:hypothetical protein